MVKPKEAKTKDRLCPNCGSNELSIGLPGLDGRPRYDCRKCGAIFPSAIEIYKIN